MKIAAKLGCSCLCILLSFASFAQSLVTYGSNNISKTEFLRAFVKNNSEQKNSEKAIRDYLELYIRFKLKVKAAYDLKLDTLANQKAELTEFSRQIAEGYLNDEASFTKLVEEAFARSQKDLHLAHIFIAFDKTNSDTAKAWKLASAAYSELQKGSDFANVAGIYSSDSSVHVNHGDLGYITVFTLPHDFENIAYSTPVGKFSRPFRSNAGYHIFKVMDERKAVGKIRIAQILLAFPENAGNGPKAINRSKADSIYAALQKGASFDQLANRYSNDNPGFAANGAIPVFGVGNYDNRFESPVFSLGKDNEFSKPIETSVGVYIVKRLQRFPVNADPANDSAMSILKDQVRADPRMDVSRAIMLKKIQQLSGFKKAPLTEKNLWAYADSIEHGKKPSPGISDKTLLFSFPDKNIYVGDWISTLELPANIANDAHGEIFGRLLHQFEQTKAREYYLDHLEKYDADFAAQVKEFREGNLLFEIMQRNIWEKASADSVGLKKYYESNKTKYWWEPSVDGIIFTCVDSVTAYSIKNILSKNKDWKSAIQPFENKVQADSGRFELNQLPFRLSSPATKGMTTEPLKNTNDNNISFLYIAHEYKEKAARNYEDAKGFVLSDYQAFLEEKWIDSLKKKYPVKVNEPLLQTLWK